MIRGLWIITLLSRIEYGRRHVVPSKDTKYRFITRRVHQSPKILNTDSLAGVCITGEAGAALPGHGPAKPAVYWYRQGKLVLNITLSVFTRNYCNVTGNITIALNTTYYEYVIRCLAFNLQGLTSYTIFDPWQLIPQLHSWALQPVWRSIPTPPCGWKD